MDNEKDNDSTLLSYACKKSSAVQGEPGKKDSDKITCPVCLKEFKRRGLPIHQAKSGCKAKLLQESLQRKLSKSEASSTPDTNHSGAGNQVNLNSDLTERNEEAEYPKITQTGQEKQGSTSDQQLPGPCRNTRERKLMDSGESGEEKSNAKISTWLDSKVEMKSETFRKTITPPKLLIENELEDIKKEKQEREMRGMSTNLKAWLKKIQTDVPSW